MEKRKIVQVYYGRGKGKSTAAIGQCVRAINRDEQVIVIQFLKGKERDDMKCLERFESNIKVVHFEKYQKSYRDLTDEEKQDERENLKNGFHYATKVAETGECDLLVLDEVLGLIDLRIIDEAELIRLIAHCDDSMHLILTGQNLPESLLPYADIVSQITPIKELQQ